MISKVNGKITLEVEVTNISQHGFWVMINHNEYFIPFKYFPWFKDAKVSDISSVEMISEKHLYWKNLDIDLSLEMIIAPEKYPLVSK